MSSQFDGITDWPRLLHEVIDIPGSHQELAQIEPDATTPAAILGALFGVLGPQARERMADAAVSLVETGTPSQAKAVLTIGLQLAPRAAARIGATVQHRRSELDDITVDALLDRSLQQDPSDRAVVTAVDDEARTRGWRMMYLMAPYRPDWVVAHLALVSTASDADGRLLARIVDRTRTQDLPALLDAIAGAGADYVSRLHAGMKGWPDKARQRVAPALGANAAYARTP